MKRVCYFLPFPAEVKCFPLILRDMLRIVKLKGFDFLKNNACAIFVEVLALSPEDLAAFKLPDEMIPDMKAQIKLTLSGEPARIKKVVGKLTNASRDRVTLEQILAS
jgi:hypothetical protein